MNNEELKKKICDIIAPYVSAYGNDERIADALIAAGIVDKSDYASMKETAVRYKAEVSKAGARVKEAEAEANRYEMLYKLQNRDMALAERRAHDAEHRAEVAERAAIILSKWLADKTRKDYPYQAWLEAAQKQAKKELAEERKDD